MIEFGRPDWLWGLLALPVLAVAMAAGVRRRRAGLDRFVGSRLGAALAPGASWRRHAGKGALRLGALAMLLVAIPAPRFGSQLVKVEREGIDLVIALDVSLSMLAEDVPPNRLERAKREIADLVEGLQGDRVGLVIFAGEAASLCPLTVDYDAALMLARSVDVFSVSEPGSAVAAAIEVATAMFDGSEGGDRVIILVTDGENQEGDPEQAARAAAQKGIRVYAIGLGSPKGELIPERAPDGAVLGYKKDTSGETVLSRLDEGMLQRVASAGGGQYLPATPGGLEIKALYDAIAGMDRRLIKGEFVERRRERFAIPLAAAFILLLLDALVTTRAGGRRRRALHTGVAVVLVAVCSLGVAGTARADAIKRGKVRAGNKLYGEGEYAKAFAQYRAALGDTTRAPEDAQGVYYNGGNALYMQQKYGPAVEYYQRSYSPDSVLTGRMLYNRGNALLKAGRAQDAAESYIQALQYLPDDEDARHNLEVALATSRQQQQQEKQQQQGNEDQQDQQDRQNEQQQGGSSDSTAADSKPRPQEGEEGADKQEEQQDATQQKADSSQAQPQPADTTMAPLSEEQLRQLSPEDAMRILQALEDREQQLQKERRKAAFRKLKRSGKDW